MNNVHGVLPAANMQTLSLVRLNNQSVQIWDQTVGKDASIKWTVCSRSVDFNDRTNAVFTLWWLAVCIDSSPCAYTFTPELSDWIGSRAIHTFKRQLKKKTACSYLQYFFLFSHKRPMGYCSRSFPGLSRMRKDVMALLVAAVYSEAFRVMKSPFGLASPGCFRSLCLEQSAAALMKVSEGETVAQSSAAAKATKQVSFISSSLWKMNLSLHQKTSAGPPVTPLILGCMLRTRLTTSLCFLVFLMCMFKLCSFVFWTWQLELF